MLAIFLKTVKIKSQNKWVGIVLYLSRSTRKNINLRPMADHIDGSELLAVKSRASVLALVISGFIFFEILKHANRLV